MQKHVIGTKVIPTQAGIEKAKLDARTEGEVIKFGIDEKFIKVMVGKRRTAEYFPSEYWQPMNGVGF